MAAKKTDENRKKYLADYYERNRDELRKKKRDWYQKKRTEVIEGLRKKRPTKTPREKGFGEGKVQVRRNAYMIADGRVFFNSRLGFNERELRAILAELKGSRVS